MQFYLAMYWAQELAAQTEDKELAPTLPSWPRPLTDNEAQIVAELKMVQGQRWISAVTKADSEKCKAVMRPEPDAECRTQGRPRLRSASDRRQRSLASQKAKVIRPSQASIELQAGALAWCRHPGCTGARRQPTVV